MIKRLLPALILSFIAVSALGQNNLGYRIFDSIPVMENGAVLQMPWGGGFNNPQFSKIDLDGDNIEDLFVFDRDGNTVKTFLNSGTSGQVDYMIAPEFRSRFPNMEGFALLRDLNCDGHPDLFTYTPGGIKLYNNDFNTELNFSLREDLLLALFGGAFDSNIFIIPNDVPSIEDIDDDGDLDIVSFGIGSTQNFMVYYRNLSMDKYGTCDSIDFEFASTCWGNVWEPNFSQFLNRLVCKNGGITSDDGFSGFSRSHPGSTLLTIDLDGDADKDLIIGDIAGRTLLSITNTGDLTTANLDTLTQDTLYPFNSVGANMEFMPAAYNVDVDNDGLRDLLVGPNNTTDPSFNVDNSWYYKNTGTNSTPNFQYQTSNFLSDQMIDVGRSAYPLFFDVNGDGMLDLLIGRESRRGSNGLEPGGISYYRNTAAFAFAPEFTLVTDDFQGFSALGVNGMTLTKGDLDGDGDLDLMIGNEAGFVHWLVNDPVNDSAVFTLNQPANFMNIDVSWFSAPQLVDVNEDGLLDLLIGDADGEIGYYENTGSATVPQFDSLPTIPVLGGITSNNSGFNERAIPFLTRELDSLGTPFLCVGTESSILRVYEGIDANLNDTFNVIDSIFTHGSRIALTGDDLLQDGTLDLIFGEASGGVTFMTKAIDIPIGVAEPTSVVEDLALYPNPANESINLEYELIGAEFITVEIFDILGQRVTTERWQAQPGSQTRTFDLSDFGQGAYFLRFQAGDDVESRRFIVSH